MNIKDIKNYKEILAIVNKHKSNIHRNFNLQPDQIMVQKPLIDKILTTLNKPYYKDINKVQIIKTIIRDILKLKDNDLIMVKNGAIFVKLFDDSKKKKITKKELNTIANRYNGIPEEDLEDFYDEYFDKDDLEYLFSTVSQNFIKKYFVKHHMTHTDYEKNAFGIIQKLILKELQEDFDGDEDFYIGFSGYIFRKHFKTTFEYISSYMLKEAVMANRYILSFLDYYSNDIIVFEGKKYKVPSLEAENGLKWHALSMIARIKPYVMALQYIQESSNIIKNIEKSIKALYIDDMSPIEYNENNIEIMKEIREEIRECDIDIEKTQDLIHTLKNKNSEERRITELENEISKIRKEKSELRDELLEIRQEIVEKANIKQYEKLLQEKKTLQHNIYVRSKVIKQSKESYMSIRNSLTKALMSKKQLIKKNKT